MDERLRFVARLLDGEAMSDVAREFGDVGRQPRFVFPALRRLALRRAKLSECCTSTALRHLEFPPHTLDNGTAAGGA